MRRAQSVRNYHHHTAGGVGGGGGGHHRSNTMLALGADDLGVLREGDESNEDVLRRQLIDKDREVDRMQTQIQLLQAQLAQRPPLEAVQELEKEYKNLELLLKGTQRENERCMTELERAKTREKMLETNLAKLAGENWQTALDIPSIGGAANAFNASTISSPIPAPHQFNTATTTTTSNGAGGGGVDTATLTARVEQVRMLILGMEQRLQGREEKLEKTVERAEKAEGEMRSRAGGSVACET